MHKVLLVAVTLMALSGAANAMSLTDFLLDADELGGQTVSVSGVAVCLSPDVCFLYKDAGSPMTNVTFSPKALSREDRKGLINCQMCKVEVTGQVTGNPSARITAAAIRFGDLSKGSLNIPAPLQIKPILDQERELNEACRGGSGDNPKTQIACEKRDVIFKQIVAQGWCWGREDDYEYQKFWRPCDESRMTASDKSRVPGYHAN